MSSPRPNVNEIRKRIRLTEEARRLHLAVNPPRDPSVLSKSSSAYLERAQREELKANDQAIARIIVEDMEMMAEEAKEERREANESDINKKNGILIPKLSAEIVNSNLNSVSLRVPNEILFINLAPFFPLFLPKNPAASLSVKPDTKTLNALALTCRRTQALFQSSLVDIRMDRLRQLLQAGVYGNLNEVEKILKSDPKLIFLSGPVVTDYSGRQIQQTIYQIALSARDVHVRFKNGVYQEYKESQNNKLGGLKELVERIAKQFSNWEIELEKQRTEAFPEGWQAEEEKQNAADLQALAKFMQALEEAKEVDNEEALVRELEEPLQELRDYFLDAYCNPNNIIRTGYHFRHQVLLRAYQFDEDNYSRFGGDNTPKNNIMWEKIIGFLQRFIPACDAMGFCQGLYYVVNNGEPCRRSLKFRFGGGVFFPLDLDPNVILGLAGCVAHDGGGRGWGGLRLGLSRGVRATLGKLISSKNIIVARGLMQLPDNLQKTRCCLIM